MVTNSTVMAAAVTDSAVTDSAMNQQVMDYALEPYYPNGVIPMDSSYTEVVKMDKITTNHQEVTDYDVEPYYPDGAATNEDLAQFFLEFWRDLTNESFCSGKKDDEHQQLAGE